MSESKYHDGKCAICKSESATPVCVECRVKLDRTKACVEACAGIANPAAIPGFIEAAKRVRESAGLAADGCYYGGEQDDCTCPSCEAGRAIGALDAHIAALAKLEKPDTEPQTNRCELTMYSFPPATPPKQEKPANAVPVSDVPGAVEAGVQWIMTNAKTQDEAKALAAKLVEEVNERHGKEKPLTPANPGIE